ncbi:MAG: glycosyltransferase [Chitinophagaceae bacterium]|jgi:glycosyltransferase involved in cell wall biosynthesis
MSTRKDILFLLPYPLHRAPSQRFRVENLLFLLDESGKTYDLAPFMTESVWKILYQNGGIVQKALGITKSYLKRWAQVLFTAHRYDVIFIHREAAPLGPPIVEWYLKKVLGKKFIYDYDDAIWIPNTSAQNKIASLIKAFWKVKYICKWSYKISGGNDFLCDFARQSGAQKINRIPTVVNTDTRYNQLKQHQSGNITIGWTGSHSTLKFLDELMPVLQRLQKEYDFTFVVIADKKPELPLEKWTFLPWNEQTEISDLLQIDIGVMPLKNDAWSEGKCGFKLIQYLSLGIPAVANSVGVNKLIVEDGVNGFIADDDQSWGKSLRLLLEDESLRSKFGAAGRKKMVDEYSIASIKQSFLRLFE